MTKDEVIALVNKVGIEHIVTSGSGCDICGEHWSCVSCPDRVYADHTIDMIIDAIEDAWPA